MPLSSMSYCSERRGMSSGMYVSLPNFSFGKSKRALFVLFTSSSDAFSNVSTTCFRTWSSKSGFLTLGRNFWRGSSSNSFCIESSGLKPTNASNGPRARAISGLWFESVN